MTQRTLMTDAAEITNLQSQLAAHRRTLAVYLRQRAALSAAYAPPGVHNGIVEARAKIKQLKTNLRTLGVIVDDHPDDIENHQAATSHSNAPSPEDRAAMICKVRHDWIDEILKQLLLNAPPTMPRLAEFPGAVARPYNQHLYANREELLLPEGTTIQNVYAAQQRAFLILGESDSVITILLLKLADTLLSQAEQDPAHPIPVVFNLVTWGDQQPALANWLIDQLHDEYSVPLTIGAYWVNVGAILPLLDGLGKVAEQRRAACAAAINAYRSEREISWAAPIVVCCGVREYAALPALRLHGAILVHPTNDQPIEPRVTSSFERPELYQEASDPATRAVRQRCGRWLAFRRTQRCLNIEMIAARTGLEAHQLTLLEAGQCDPTLLTEQTMHALSLILENEQRDFTHVKAIIRLALGRAQAADAQELLRIADELDAPEKIAEPMEQPAASVDHVAKENEFQDLPEVSQVLVALTIGAMTALDIQDEIAARLRQDPIPLGTIASVLTYLAHHKIIEQGTTPPAATTQQPCFRLTPTGLQAAIQAVRLEERRVALEKQHEYAEHQKRIYQAAEQRFRNTLLAPQS